MLSVLMTSFYFHFTRVVIEIEMLSLMNVKLKNISENILADGCRERNITRSIAFSFILDKRKENNLQLKVACGRYCEEWLWLQLHHYRYKSLCLDVRSG